MAVPEPIGPNDVAAAVGHQWTGVQKGALELYVQGYSRPEVAMKLARFEFPKHKFPDRKLARKMMRTKLAKWEKTAWFRDALWERVQHKVDLESAAIMKGVVKQAKKGKIDAAKFALTVAGRYQEKDNSVGPVTIVFGGIPRPDRAIEPLIAIEGTVVEEEDG